MSGGLIPSKKKKKKDRNCNKVKQKDLKHEFEIGIKTTYNL